MSTGWNCASREPSKVFAEDSELDTLPVARRLMFTPNRYSEQKANMIRCPHGRGTQTCARDCRGILVARYLKTTEDLFNNFSIHRVAELTPKAWAAKHNQPAS